MRQKERCSKVLRIKAKQKKQTKAARALLKEYVYKKKKAKVFEDVRRYQLGYRRRFAVLFFLAA